MKSAMSAQSARILSHRRAPTSKYGQLRCHCNETKEELTSVKWFHLLNRVLGIQCLDSTGACTLFLCGRGFLGGLKDGSASA
jgi:hypothetical protein